jgi:hypothetical protein
VLLVSSARCIFSRHDVVGISSDSRCRPPTAHRPAAAGLSLRRFLWLRHAANELYVTQSGVAALAARAMSSRTAHHFYDQLLVKEPGTVAATPWHNDTSYWHLNGSMICSVWLAMDTVPKETGVSYVRGSHTWKLRHAVSSFSGGGESNYDYGDQSSLSRIPDIEAGVASGEYELIQWDMEPGDVIVFNSFSMQCVHLRLLPLELHAGPSNLPGRGLRSSHLISVGSTAVVQWSAWQREGSPTAPWLRNSLVWRRCGVSTSARHNGRRVESCRL